jgi:hypothetical protein
LIIYCIDCQEDIGNAGRYCRQIHPMLEETLHG